MQELLLDQLLTQLFWFPQSYLYSFLILNEISPGAAEMATEQSQLGRRMWKQGMPMDCR